MNTPPAPPLPDDLDALLRRLRLPHVRRHAPDVLATAQAQRWEPAEVLRALFTEEAPAREDVRRLGSARLLDLSADPAGPAHAGMGPPAGEPRRCRPRRHRQDVPARGPRPAGGRAGTSRRLAHPRSAPGPRPA